MDSSTSAKKVNLCEICKAPAKKRCTCGTAYCSVECQKMIWYTHKLIHDHDMTFLRQPDIHLEEVKLRKWCVASKGQVYNEILFLKNVHYYIDQDHQVKDELDSLNKEANNLQPIDRNIYIATFRSKIVDELFASDAGLLLTALRPLGMIKLLAFYRVSHSTLTYGPLGIPADHSNQLMHLEFIYNSLIFNPNMTRSNATNSILKQINTRLYSLITNLSKNRSNVEYYGTFVQAFKLSEYRRCWESVTLRTIGSITSAQATKSIQETMSVPFPTYPDWIGHKVY